MTPADGVLSAPSSLYPNLYWLRVPHGGKARALNAAITVMTTETVMTVDADTLLDDDATYAMRAAFARANRSWSRRPAFWCRCAASRCRAAVPVVPDLRVHAQLHVAFCVDARG